MLILIVAIVCVLGLRVYNGHIFFFGMPDRSGWVGEGDGLRYLDRHAGVVTDTLLEIDGKTYYFDIDGVVYKGEIVLDGETYFFDEGTGVMHTGWMERNGNRYYYEENGHKVIGRLHTIGENDFLFDAEGAEYIGPIEINGTHYYFEAFTGKLHDSEKQLDGIWYYYTEDGSRFGTGWLTLPDGRTCYYDGDAGMLYGEQTIDGKPYLLNISMGGRFTGTTYYNGEVYDIGADGVVIGKERTPVWRGIDVSWHQGPVIDWAAAKASGVEFAIVRAGWISPYEEPLWQPDSRFEQNVLGAQAQGISVGAYIYVYNYTEEGLIEAIDSFHEDISASRVRLDLPVFLDIECEEYFKPGSDALGGFDYRTDLVRLGMERLRSHGHDTGFYTFSVWAGREFDAEQLFNEGYPFWLARWYSNDMEQESGTLSWDGDKQPSVWQYRATGSVDGIEGEVDMNYLYWDRMPPQ